MHHDRERCLRAVRSRDARFDGWFYAVRHLWATGDHAVDRLSAA